jgi:hypothetical protein
MAAPNSPPKAISREEQERLNNALIEATWDRNVDLAVLGRLLEDGAQVNTKDYHGETSLHRMACCGNTEAVKLLLEKGADVNSENDVKETPLHLAIVSDCSTETAKLEIVMLLLEKGANVNATIGGNTLLHFAVIGNSTGAAKLLLEKGVDIGARNWDGCTALDLTRSRLRDIDPDLIALLKAAAKQSAANPNAALPKELSPKPAPSPSGLEGVRKMFSEPQKLLTDPFALIGLVLGAVVGMLAGGASGVMQAIGLALALGLGGALAGGAVHGAMGGSEEAKKPDLPDTQRQRNMEQMADMQTTIQGETLGGALSDVQRPAIGGSVLAPDGPSFPGKVPPPNETGIPVRSCSAR